MRTNERGFTLLETLVAIFVLTMGIFGLYSLQIASVRGNTIAAMHTQASNQNALTVERLLAEKFDDLEDENDDGQNTDVDIHVAFDPDKHNLLGLDGGLWDRPVGDDWCHNRGHKGGPDQCEESKDGNYVIFYNVAVNYPVVGVKTVRAHVRH